MYEINPFCGLIIAPKLRAALCSERYGQIRIDETVVAFVRFVKGFVAGVVFIVEVAQIDYNAAQRRRVTVEIF